MQPKKGSATVSVAAIGVSPMASSARTANQMVRLLCVRSGRRDADQSARDARDPQNELHGYGLTVLPAPPPIARPRALTNATSAGELYLIDKTANCFERPPHVARRA